MTQHLLLVSLGPVQELIASARRCQDLWFGSSLLSDLARATAKGIAATAGDDALVFPAPRPDDFPATPRDHPPPVANKIVAVLADGVDPARVADDGRAAMAEELDALARRAFDKLPQTGWDRELAERQVRDLIEYVWVAAPFAPGYAGARSLAERLLAARKSTRRWGPVPWAPIPGRPKSSLDGLRESVLHESLYDTMEPEALRRLYFVKRSERLCGVGLLKRAGEEIGADGDRAARRVFHSNSHVTAGPLLVRLARAGEAGQRALAGYVDALRALGVAVDRFRIGAGARKLSSLRDPLAHDAAPIQVPRTFGEQGLDGYLLFEDRLPEVLEGYAPGHARRPPRERDERVQRARGALKGFLDAIGQPGPPAAYYALLVADGDRMGDAIGKLAGVDAHRALSGALAVFASESRTLVEEHGGSFVYSGGDDVLALLPLHTALACANALQRAFGDTLRKRCPALEPVPTLSVGLGVAHHLEVMGEVRELAKQAEAAAKRKRGSLGIAVGKRSGATLEITGAWGESPPLHRRLDVWCRLFRAEELPDGVAFELEEAVAPFELREPGDAAGLRDVVLALARRVIGRKRSERGEEPLDAETARTLAERFEKPGVDPLRAVKELSHELQVARLFLSAYEIAWGDATR